MAVTVIIGMQWGDEGKGKIIDLIVKDYDYVVRFNGGDNAGHTIKHGDKKLALHLIPSAVFYPEKYKIIGNGLVVNPESLMKEISEAETLGFSAKNLYISEAAHLVLPWHKVLDGIEDEKNTIGTTKKGIGPAFSDKANRISAIRMMDLKDAEKLREKIEKISELKEKIVAVYGKKAEFNVEEILMFLKEFYRKMQGRIVDTSLMLHEAIERKKSILLEGAQATLLDIDHGTYPYVTSSNTTAGGACTGSGIPPGKINKIIGIAKAYLTRVGEGPFPTELKDSVGDKIRKKGQEFGTTTGRPRRCGWLDLVALRYAVRINDAKEIALMKIDVLSGLENINVCIAYNVNDKITKNFPLDSKELAGARPVYKTFAGWDITENEWQNIAKTKKFPAEIKNYLDFIEKEACIKITMLSYGPKREETIML